MARTSQIPSKIKTFLASTPPYVHPSERVAAGVEGSLPHVSKTLREMAEAGEIGRTSEAANGAGVAYYPLTDPATGEPLEMMALDPTEVAVVQALRAQKKS